MATSHLLLSELPLTMTREPPKLLLIAQTIPQTIHAGEILLYRLLKDYPSDKLLVIGPPAHPDANLLRCRYETIAMPFERLAVSRFARWSRSLRVAGIIPRMKSRSVTSRLGRFQPDIVLSVMQTHSYYDLAYRFAKSSRLPLVLIVYDIPEEFEKVHSWADYRQVQSNAEIYRYAKKRLCVSPEMNGYLHNAYGELGDVLYPNPSEHTSPRSLRDARDLKEPGFLTIGYAGSLGYGYGPQLQRMIPAFREAGVKLRVYSRGILVDDAPDVVSYESPSPLPEMTWSKVKDECDAVILPYCWPQDGHQNLYRVHFPSKLPEYLALGMPVIVVGPEYATGVKWAAQNSRAAIAISENDRAAWIEALRVLKESATLRTELSEQSVIAAKCFDPSRIRSEFLNHLTEAVS